MCVNCTLSEERHRNQKGRRKYQGKQAGEDRKAMVPGGKYSVTGQSLKSQIRPPEKEADILAHATVLETSLCKGSS